VKKPRSRLPNVDSSVGGWSSEGHEFLAFQSRNGRLTATAAATDGTQNERA
jgi:hypothetical protein